MTLRELTVVLGLKVNHEAFEALDKRVDGIKENFKHLAEIAVSQIAAVVELTRETAKSAVEAHDMGQSYGMSAQSIMKLKYAAQETTTPVELLQGGMQMLANNASKAAQGNLEAASAFAKANISIYDGQGRLKSTDKLLMEVSERFAGMKDGIVKTGMASDLLGTKMGSRLIPFLNNGPSKLRAFGEEAERLGIVIDESGVAKSERLVMTWSRLMGVLQGMRNIIAMTVMPVLQDLIDRFWDWYNANRAMIQQQLVEFFKEAATEAVKLVRTIVSMAEMAWKLVQALGGMDNVLRLVVAGFIAWTAGSTILGILQLVKTVMLLRDAMIALGVSEAFATGGLSLIAAGIGAAAVGTYMATSGLGNKDEMFGSGASKSVWSTPASSLPALRPGGGNTVNNYNFDAKVEVNAPGAHPGTELAIEKHTKKAMDDLMARQAAAFAGGGVR